ncbi:unnamed protein product [Cylicocyclus nassatus]|uniref:Uncharacterized protein n=1 Tax=Cylicocyclus nassatus TaxID=53992 RepID=A0AA36GEP2_CYLNA|nr:unnamed protein product [Cylicocyclus nassatus]
MKLLLSASLLLGFAFYVEGEIIEHRRFKRGQQRYDASDVSVPAQVQATVDVEPSETVIKKTTYRTYQMQPTVVKKYISYGGGSVDGGTLDLSNLGISTGTGNLGGTFKVIGDPTVRVIQGSPTVYRSPTVHRHYRTKVRRGDFGRRGSMVINY